MCECWCVSSAPWSYSQRYHGYQYQHSLYYFFNEEYSTNFECKNFSFAKITTKSIQNLQLPKIIGSSLPQLIVKIFGDTIVYLERGLSRLIVGISLNIDFCSFSTWKELKNPKSKGQPTQHGFPVKTRQIRNHGSSYFVRPYFTICKQHSKGPTWLRFNCETVCLWKTDKI